MKQLSKPFPFKNEVARLPTHLFYYYILFFENKKVWAYEQLHISEQLVYKEYLNKMQFEVARMQFEAILLKAILYEMQFCPIKMQFCRIRRLVGCGRWIVVGVTICSTVSNTNM